VDGAQEAVRLGDHAAQAGQQPDEQRFAIRLGEGLVFGPAEGVRAFVVLGDVAGRLIGEAEAQLVARLVAVGPVDQAVLAHDKPFEGGVRLGHGLHLHAQLEAGTQPVNIADLVAVNLLGQAHLICRGGDGDHRYRVGVIDMVGGDEGVEGGVDGGGAGVEVVGAVAEHRHHGILKGVLQPLSGEAR
jgi:hypothetical protein